MVTEIRGTAGENWLNYCRAVLAQGKEFYDEHEKILELLDVYLVFEQCDPQDPILARFADQHIVDLYRRKMVSTEIIPELNLSYGKRLYDQLGVDQVKWLTDRLKSKPETKAATISLILPNDPGPRIPCLSMIDVKIREGQLHLTGFFRSQNVARSYGNFIAIGDLHRKIAREVGYPTGEIKLFVASAHIYEKDTQAVRDVLARADAETPVHIRSPSKG